MSSTKESSKESSQPQPHLPIPPTFNPGPKLSADGRTTFHKDPAREAFDAEWRAAVARGEDPTRNLQRRVEATGSSSFIEYWWRKARGKKATRVEEREAVDGRRRERVEGGVEGLLGADGYGEGDRGEEEEEEGGERGRDGGDEGAGMEGERRKKKSKLHDRLRWGI